jgi:hypothetical protein
MSLPCESKRRTALLVRFWGRVQLLHPHCRRALRTLFCEYIAPVATPLKLNFDVLSKGQPMKNRIFGNSASDAATVHGHILTTDFQELRRFDRPRLFGSVPMSTTVRMCMDRLRGQGISLDDYTGPAEDVACDLLTAEACITALASRILDNQDIPRDLRQLAPRPLLQDSSTWLLPDGRTFDLGTIPLLRAYARQIDRLRQACAEALR